MPNRMSLIDYESDDLTEVYNRRAFYIHTRELLNANADDNFMICAIDIDKFKVINDLFGTKAGDGVLKYLAHSLLEFDPDNKKCLVGRMHADNFMMCLVDEGNTVLVIEHNLDVIKTADYIIDLGPDAGVNGGEIVYQGDMSNLQPVRPLSITEK